MKLFFTALAIIFLLSACNQQVEEPIPPGDVKYPAALRDLVTAKCASCHGLGASGGTITIRDILDEEELIRTGMVRPGDAENSPLYQSLVRQNPMPLGQAPLNDGEKQLFFDYIQKLGGGTVVPAPVYTPYETVLREIYLDLLTVNEFDRDDTRYLLAVGYGDGIRLRLALNKALNLIHFKTKLTPVSAVGSIEAYRINLQDFELAKADWDRIIVDAKYPYYVEYDPEDEPQIVFYDEQIEVLTENDKTVSYIRADWFVFEVLQSPFYYDFLGIPKTEAELLAFLDIDEQDQIEEQDAYRAGIRESNVANFNRVSDTFELVYNLAPFSIETTYWRTYDFAATDEVRNVFVNPFGPPKFLTQFVETKREFVHDAGEVIFGLPNGLSGYVIYDGVGNRLDEVDPAIATDKLNFGVNYLGAGAGSIVNAVSCSGCHARGMNLYQDQLKNHILNTGNFNLQETLFAKDFFYEQGVLQKALSDYNVAFQGSQKNLGITEPQYLQQSGEPTYATARQYRNYVSACELAAEVYLDCAEFKFRLTHAGDLALALGFDENANGRANRDDVERLFGQIVFDLDIGKQKLFSGVIAPPQCDWEVWNASKWAVKVNIKNKLGNFIYYNMNVYPTQFVRRRDMMYQAEATLVLRNEKGEAEINSYVIPPCGKVKIESVSNHQEVSVHVSDTR